MEQLELEIQVTPEEMRQEIDLSLRRIRMEMAYFRARTLRSHSALPTGSDKTLPEFDGTSDAPEPAA